MINEKDNNQSCSAEEQVINEKDQFLILIGKRIKELREAKDITQLALGLESGISNRMSLIESGKVDFGIYTLKRIADALDVSLVDILMPPEKKENQTENTIEPMFFENTTPSRDLLLSLLHFDNKVLFDEKRPDISAIVEFKSCSRYNNGGRDSLRDFFQFYIALQQIVNMGDDIGIANVFSEAIIKKFEIL